MSELDNLSNELEAMKTIAETLDKLSEEARARVLQWVLHRVPQHNVQTALPFSNKNDVVVSAQTNEEYYDLPSLYDAAMPRDGSEKVLVVCYWMQKIDGQQDFSSQPVNNELKNMGHPVANITAAFSSLINSRYAMQIRKSGTSQQARKKYKLTLAGIKKVEEMLTLNKGV